MNFTEELFSVRKKIVIVTGASRGIGHRLATSFSQAGAEVIGIGRTNKIETQEFNYYSIDTRKQNTFSDLCNNIYKNHGGINVLINAAGISLSVNSNKGDSYNEFAAILETNLTATFSCCNIVSSFMKKGDTIINISSIGANLAFPNNPGYQASKGGLSSLTRSLAYDLSIKNIRVNNIVPGYIRTQMTQESFDDNKLRADRENRMLIKRWGETQDLVGAAIFLASDASRYTTGSDVYVDGGWSVKGI